MKAVLYARSACTTQESEATLESQLEALRNQANRRGMEIIEEFRDGGYSGLRLPRPGLDRLRELAQRSGFDVLLTCGPDRLARDSVLLDRILQELAQLGIRTFFLKGNVKERAPCLFQHKERLAMAKHVYLHHSEKHLNGKLSMSKLKSLLQASQAPMLDPYGGRDSSAAQYFNGWYRIWTIRNDGEIASVAYTKTGECYDHKRVDTQVAFGWFRREEDSREDFLAWNPVGEHVDQSKKPELVQQAKDKLAAILAKHPRGLTHLELLERYGFAGRFTSRQVLKLLRSMPDKVSARKVATGYTHTWFPSAPTNKSKKTAVKLAIGL